MGPLPRRVAVQWLLGRIAPSNVETPTGSFIEPIAPGAFRASFTSGADIVAVQDHAPDKIGHADVDRVLDFRCRLATVFVPRLTSRHQILYVLMHEDHTDP